MTDEYAATGDDWGDSVDAANAEGLFDMDAGNVDSSKVGSRTHIEKIGKYHVELVDAKNDFETLTNRGNEKSPCVLVTCEVQASEPGLSPPRSIYWHRVDVGGKGGRSLEDWQLGASVNFLYGVGLLRKSFQVEVEADENSCPGVGYGFIKDLSKWTKPASGESDARDEAELLKKSGWTATVGIQFIDPETGTTKINVPTLAVRLKGLQAIFEMKLNKSDDPQYDDKIELPFGRGAFRVDDPAVSDVPMNADALAVRKPYPAGEFGGCGAAKAPAAAAPAAAQQQQATASPAPAQAPAAPPQQPAQQQQAEQPAPATAAAPTGGGEAAWNMDDL